MKDSIKHFTLAIKQLDIGFSSNPWPTFGIDLKGQSLHRKNR